MAFEQYNWSCISSSLNQGLVTAAIDTPTGASSVQQGTQNVFTYFSPSDSIATISASNYFLSQVQSLKVGDMIFVEGSDFNDILEVTVVTLPADGSSGAVDTAAWLNDGSLVEFSTTTHLTNSQLLGMFATPVELVTPQGAGTIILVDKMVIDYDWSTADTAAGGAIAAQYGNAADGAGPAATQTIDAATLNGLGEAAILTAGSAQVAQADTAVFNTGIYLSNATAAFTTGAGSATVYTYYRVLTPA